MTLADTTVVVLVPEAGDTVQTMKAGLLEIGDIFVVNKADRPGADKIATELTSMVEMATPGGGKLTDDDIRHHGDSTETASHPTIRRARGLSPLSEGPTARWNTPVLLTQATRDEGIDELLAAIDEHIAHIEESGAREADRRALRRREFLELLVEDYARSLDEKAQSGAFAELVSAVESGAENPYTALAKARYLLKS